MGPTSLYILNRIRFMSVTMFFSYRYRCSSCRCTSIPICHTSKDIFWCVFTCRLRIGCASVPMWKRSRLHAGRVGCTSVPMWKWSHLHVGRADFHVGSCRYWWTIVSVYMSVAASPIREPIWTPHIGLHIVRCGPAIVHDILTPQPPHSTRQTHIG